MNSNILFFIGLLGAVFFFVFYLRDYIFKDQIPEGNQSLMFEYRCAIKIHELIFTYPLCNLKLYEDYIHISYLWSRVIIPLNKLEGLYLNTKNELVLKQGKAPNVLTISFGDLQLLKGNIEKQLDSIGIRLMHESL